jgi:AmmeMemoRadiSam system protein B
MTQLPADQPPAFDPSKPHLQQPKLRPVRGFPAQAQGPDGNPIQMMGLVDATQISDKVCIVIPAVQLILGLLDGTRKIDAVVEQVGRGLTRPFVEQLVAQLDDAGMLEGPTFEALYTKLKADFDASPNLPPAATDGFVAALIQEAVQTGKLAETASEQEKDAYGKTRLKEVFEHFCAEALKDVTDPAMTTLPKAIVAPHLDYGRGWVNYASIYGRLRVADRPDRVIILGTNHHGRGTGVTLCDKGYTTAFGTCQADMDVVRALQAKLGDKVLASKYDHEREHSIELQIPWIQHVFGFGPDGTYPKVVGILVHDPAVRNGESYDGQGIAYQPFVDAMKELVRKLPGKTLVVSSADLSHVGPGFGDQVALAVPDEADDTAKKGAEDARNKVFAHDNELINHIANKRVSELMAAMAWQQNPTRWCSTGNLCAAIQITEPADVKILNYSAAMDPQGMTMVTSIAAVMV